MNENATMVERRGLYYPWVHFQSDEWVKKALLVFPGLFRMVASEQAPHDSLLVYQLRGHSLIRHADLGTPNADLAQCDLLRLISEDLDADAVRFRQLFGREAANQTYQPSFQMHLGKTSADLGSFLQTNGLAWTPDDAEESDYSELHPDLGQAVMGTIAMACAEDAGLHIVGADSPRGKDVSAVLNSTLNAKDRDGPYNRFVRKAVRPGVVQASAEELFHVVVKLNCDVSHLDAASLVKLQEEREPLRVLKRRVQELAAEMPEMRDPKMREEAFRDKADDIVRYWQKDRANLSRFAREMFALDAFGGGAAKFLNVMADKIVPLGAAGAVGTQIFNATAGLAIGLLTHIGASYRKVRKAEEDSPWRYMTLAQHEGVTFSVSTNKESQNRGPEAA